MTHSRAQNKSDAHVCERRFRSCVMLGGMGETAAGGIRERNRAAIEAAIIERGRAQLAEVGAAALSLRAIARDLGMVSSAVYRYVANRDDLLTLLIVAVYDDLGDAVDAALATAGADVRDRFDALCHALRGWALAHPHDYALIYGSPVPDYHAPADRTGRAGTRIQVQLARILADLCTTPPRSRDPEAVAAAAVGLARVLQDPLFAQAVAESTRSGRTPKPEEVLRGLAAWSLVMGAVSAEVFEQLGADTIADPDAYFAGIVALARDLILR